MASATANQPIPRLPAVPNAATSDEVSAEPRQTTLLELVRVVSETTDDEQEVVATVLHILRSGSVRLMGNFRDASIDLFSR